MDQPAARSPRYSAVAIGLHWAIAGMLLGMIWTGWNMHDANGREVEWLYQLHKSVGITILLLTIARVIWRVKNPPPPLPEGMKTWEKTASHYVHLGFYAVMIFIPIGGWVLASTAKVQVPTVLFGTVSWPHLPILADLSAGTKEGIYATASLFHKNSDKLILALLALHIGGALKHEFSEEEGVLKRMIPGLFGKTDGPQAPPTGFFVAFGSAFAAFMLVAGGPVLAQSISGNNGSDLEITPVTSMAPNWEVDAENSSITFTFTHDGETHEGSFSEWNADILFMEDNLGASKVYVTVDLASAVVPKKLYSDSLKAAEWFDSNKTPQALVELDSFAQVESGFTAEASLTIKGTTVTEPFAFTLTENGGKTIMNGSTTLKRKPLNLGQDSDPTADWVSEEIAVAVTVAANRK